MILGRSIRRTHRMWFNAIRSMSSVREPNKATELAKRPVPLWLSYTSPSSFDRPASDERKGPTARDNRPVAAAERGKFARSFGTTVDAEQWRSHVSAVLPDIKKKIASYVEQRLEKRPKQ